MKIKESLMFLQLICVSMTINIATIELYSQLKKNTSLLKSRNWNSNDLYDNRRKKCTQLCSTEYNNNN